MNTRPPPANRRSRATGEHRPAECVDASLRAKLLSELQEGKELVPSQDLFADKTGLHRAHVGEIERGQSNVTLQTLKLVEVKPGVQSGAPVLCGTRMPVDAIIDNFDYGVSVSEIAEQFELPPDCVQAIVTYAQSHRVANPV